ncbi:MAG: Do family serine endopeptidase [Acidobacteria bacterium]|nr:Do family serine endopeptidase [Acidobacteriota bacterium]
MERMVLNREMGWLRKHAGILVVLVAFAAGMVAGPNVTRSVSAAMNEKSTTAADQIVIPSPVQLSTEFSKITKKMAPAVVNINTESTVETGFRGRQMPFGGQDPFGGFFDQFINPRDMPESFKQKSLGSGVIIDPDGYILTNHHVVGKADKIRVKMQDDPKSYDAKVIGTDEETDLAVIKIDASHPLPSARLGNSDDLSVGDWVLAIGSPFGLEETVTAGIISARERDLGSPFQRFLQTDAAINPGNSGGPLVNMAGEVIGINTQIASDNGNNAGVGFAVPSNTAINVYNQIVKTGKVTRGMIGVTYQTEQSPVLLRSFGAEHGVVITSVQPDGPAAKAGLQQGDVITSINGSPVNTTDDLLSKVAALPVGESTTIGYIRDKKEQKTTLMVGDRGKMLAGLSGSDATQGGGDKEGTKAKFGISVQNLTPRMAQQMGLESSSGVVVSNVAGSSFAEEIGLQRGDVITEINHQPVKNVDDLLRIQQDLKPGSDVVFLVERTQMGRSTSLYLAGTLS